jgi:hypothetical protein
MASVRPRVCAQTITTGIYHSPALDDLAGNSFKDWSVLSLGMTARVIV